MPSRPVSDDDALRALFEQHAAALLAFAVRLTGGDRGRAEDIVQETLLRAWRQPDALGDGRPARTWLYTVARNVAVDAFRARRARPPETGDEALAQLPGPDDVEHALDHWLLLDAIASLSPAHRDVIVETYYFGRSVAEVAEVLGVPLGTVKSRTFYALRALRRALDERGIRA